MAKVTSRSGAPTKPVIQAKTVNKTDQGRVPNWWESKTQTDLVNSLNATAKILQDQSQYRFRQASIFARLYGNVALQGYAGTNFSTVDQKNTLPMDRPTMNVVSSCIDTLVSRLTQSRPKPVFLTDNSDYKERKLAQNVNYFIAGEFYETHAYRLSKSALRDACIWGPGFVKVLEDRSKKKVALERVLGTELYVDQNDGFHGKPRCLYHLKLVDRGVMKGQHKEESSVINKAEQAYASKSSSEQTFSDLVLAVEAWRLPSGKDTGDGRHAIVCDSGLVLDEEWKRERFPVAKIDYSEPLVGYFGNGLALALMGSQVEINKLLITSSRAINLVGVPRVFLEKGSKVVRAHLNNEIGSIVEYSGTKPEYVVAPCVPAEVYQQLQRIIEYAYQQSGISALSAAAKKPAGLDSGAAIRQYDDLQSDRFADLAKRYEDFHTDLAYLMLDQAIEIAKRDRTYKTVFPDKDGAVQIELPDLERLENPFVIKCLDESSLPKDPAGRTQTVIERMQAGLYTPEQGRRLLGTLDTEQEDTLLNAGQERIYKILDQIVEEGKYTPPDPLMDPQMAIKSATQYYNKYMAIGLEPEKASKILNFLTQAIALTQAAAPPPSPMGPQMPGPGSPGAPTMALPEALPQSPMLPNVQSA